MAKIGDLLGNYSPRGQEWLEVAIAELEFAKQFAKQTRKQQVWAACVAHLASVPERPPLSIS